MAAPIEGIDLPMFRLVEDGIRIFTRLHFGKSFERFQIDYAHFVFAAIAGEAASQAGGNHKTVDARSVGDLTDDLVIVQIDDDHLGAVADIKPMAENIDGQVIPTALAADGDFPEKMIRTIRAEQGRREERSEERRVGR